LPYFKFLNSQREDEVGKSEFARLQREALENYLLGLIRAVVGTIYRTPLENPSIAIDVSSKL
jgi:hypothetical protein